MHSDHNANKKIKTTAKLLPPGRKAGRVPTAPGRKKGFSTLCRLLARVIFLPIFRLKISGVQNLPSNSAFILLVKHQRWEDIPLVSIAATRPLYYIAKYELFRNFVANWFFTALGGIPLNRHRPLESRRFLQTAIQLLKEGEGIVIFPEGTYYRGKMGPGQIGMVKFVLTRLKLPFIPVGINYTTASRRTDVRINFGKPYQADSTQAAEALVKRMMVEIAELSGLSAHSACR
jgi:1-acyl-sn-glycerol-3-phosphate acyltransferase